MLNFHRRPRFSCIFLPDPFFCLSNFLTQCFCSWVICQFLSRFRRRLKVSSFFLPQLSPTQDGSHPSSSDLPKLSNLSSISYFPDLSDPPENFWTSSSFDLPAPGSLWTMLLVIQCQKSWWVPMMCKVKKKLPPARNPWFWANWPRQRPVTLWWYRLDLKSQWRLWFSEW